MLRSCCSYRRYEARGWKCDSYVVDELHWHTTFLNLLFLGDKLLTRNTTCAPSIRTFFEVSKVTYNMPRPATVQGLPSVVKEKNQGSSITSAPTLRPAVPPLPTPAGSSRPAGLRTVGTDQLALAHGALTNEVGTKNTLTVRAAIARFFALFGSRRYTRALFQAASACRHTANTRSTICG